MTSYYILLSNTDAEFGFTHDKQMSRGQVIVVSYKITAMSSKEKHMSKGHFSKHIHHFWISIRVVKIHVDM